MSGITTTILVGLAVLFIVRYFKTIVAYIRFWQAMETIGGPKAHWLSGNVYRKRNEEEFHDNIKDMDRFPHYKRRWFGIFHGGIAFSDPELATSVLQKYRSKSVVYEGFKNFFADGIFSMNGAKWKHYRKLLNPAFHNEMMKSYINIFNKSALKFLQRLEDRSEFNVKEECSRVTVEAITEAIYNENCLTEIERKEYLNASNNLSNLFVQCSKNPLLFNRWFFSKTKFQKIKEDNQRILYQQSLRSIQLYKEKSGEANSKGILGILVNAKNENSEPISNAEIIGQLNTFMFAGHETTAGTISWALYLLALHQECQDKCRDEIAQVLQNKNEVSWEDLSKLSYLTMCIKETLRLYPPAYLIGRKLPKETDASDLIAEHQGTKLPENSILSIDIASIQRNPLIWKDSSSYDPLRFTPENITKRSQNSYLPFAVGPRNCIGQNFAMNEMKVILSLLLKTFRFSLHEDFPKPKMQVNVTLHMDGNFKLRITPVQS